MTRRSRWIPRAVVFALLAVVSAACGSSSSSGGPGALSGLSASQAGAKAVSDLETASSVTVSGTIKAPGTSQNVTVDLTLVRAKGCKGSVTVAGEGSFGVIWNGQTIWAQPDSQFWQAHGVSGAELAAVSGKYAQVSATSSLASFSAFCNTTLVATASGITGQNLSYGKTATIAGQHAVEIVEQADKTSAYITVSAKPEFVRINSSGLGQLTLSGYGRPVTLTPPPASQVVSGSQFGL